MTEGRCPKCGRNARQGNRAHKFCHLGDEFKVDVANLLDIDPRITGERVARDLGIETSQLYRLAAAGRRIRAERRLKERRAQ